jgi:hypothetical protein
MNTKPVNNKLRISNALEQAKAKAVRESYYLKGASSNDGANSKTNNDSHRKPNTTIIVHKK